MKGFLYRHRKVIRAHFNRRNVLLTGMATLATIFALHGMHVHAMWTGFATNLIWIWEA